MLPKIVYHVMAGLLENSTGLVDKGTAVLYSRILRCLSHSWKSWK